MKGTVWPSRSRLEYVVRVTIKHWLFTKLKALYFTAPEEGGKWEGETLPPLNAYRSLGNFGTQPRAKERGNTREMEKEKRLVDLTENIIPSK